MQTVDSRLGGTMRVEQDLDYCDVCERVVKECGKHSDEKHLSGRYGRLRQELEVEGGCKPASVRSTARGKAE
jgi:hypothetical protein